MIVGVHDDPLASEAPGEVDVRPEMVVERHRLTDVRRGDGPERRDGILAGVPSSVNDLAPSYPRAERPRPKPLDLATRRFARDPLARLGRALPSARGETEMAQTAFISPRRRPCRCPG